MAEYVYLFCYPTGRQVREIAPNKTAAIKQHIARTGTKKDYIVRDIKIIKIGKTAD